MGQGAESCGGYDLEYDPLTDEPDGVWTQRDGTTIHISRMTDRHIKNTIRVLHGSVRRATFSCDVENFESWIEAFEEELLNRERCAVRAAVKASPVLALKEVQQKPAKPKTKPRGRTIKMKCFCGDEYDARSADLSRGWALSCSKRCAAIRRDYKKPAATKVISC